MRFEWDEAERRVNLRKHGVDFADLPAVFEGTTVTVLDDRFEYSESRYITVGLLGARVVVVAHTEGEAVIRFISARKANRREEENYFRQIAD